jgi:hypothetical protein
MRRQLEEEHELGGSEEEYGDGYDEDEDDEDEVEEVDEEDDDEDDEVEEDDYEDDLDEESMTEEQRLEEGKRMFQMFAAKMFEQRVLTAYREKVSLYPFICHSLGYLEMT